MLPGERFKGWIDSLSSAWKDRLGGWLLETIGAGLTKSAEDMEPGVIDQCKETIQLIIANPSIPPETKRMLEKAIEEGNIFHVTMGWVLSIVGIIPAMFGLGGPLGNVLNHMQELAMRSQILTPEAVNSIWLRDKALYETWIDDWRRYGYDEDRIDVLKELAKIIPPLADMVRFADFSAFDPEVIEKWRAFYDAPGWITDPMSLLGITNDEPRDWANKYWFSHYVQPGRYELGDMYRRGLLGEPRIGNEEIGLPGGDGEAEETIKLAYRTMAYSEFWQDRLLQLVREIPTRVDVRRWWDMRTIDEAELRSIYQRQGYFGKDLANYVLWTKVYVAFPDLLARWSKGWITIDEVRDELITLGMPSERVEELIQTKVKAAEPGRVEAERNLTKSDIYKGVKQGIITRGQAIELLIDLGFDEDEAYYLLEINIPPDEVEEVVKERSLTKGDIKAAVKEQILSPSEATTRLIELRYSPADAEFLTSIYQRLIPEEKVEEFRELTKGDILRALRKAILTPDETLNMLLNLAYSLEDARLLVSTNMPSAEEEEEEEEKVEEYRESEGLEALPLAEVKKMRLLAKSDIKSAFKRGLITTEQAITKLEELLYSPEDARLLITLVIAVTDLEKVTIPSEQAKANLIVAVKKGLTTPEEAYLMLQEIGFTPEESEFILTVKAETSPFSPVSFQEFKDVTHKYRVAAGMEAKAMPEELKAAAAELARLTNEVEALDRSIVEEERLLVEDEVLPEAATARLTELKVTRNRALSELSRVQSEYDRLVAEWKHGLP